MKIIRIYLADLACYNEGSLVGKWIDLPCDVEEVTNEILRAGEDMSDLHGSLDKGQKHEELFITDYEAPFQIDEYDNLEDLNNNVEQLEALEDYEQKIAIYLYQNGIYDLDDAINNTNMCTLYEDMTLEDVAREMISNGCFGDIPESFLNYVDYSAIARDLAMDGYDMIGNDVYYAN